MCRLFLARIHHSTGPHTFYNLTKTPPCFRHYHPILSSQNIPRSAAVATLDSRHHLRATPCHTSLSLVSLPPSTPSRPIPSRMCLTFFVAARIL